MVPGYAREKEEVLDDVQSTYDGLSEKEAARRLEERGANEITDQSRTSWFGLLAEQFSDFLVLLLLVATGISIVLRQYLDAGAMLTIVALSVALGFFQEYRAERAVEALQKISAPHAKVVRSGILKTIPASRLVPGDIIVLEAGDVVPADARLLETSNLQAAEASLTGESSATTKNVEAVPERTPIQDQRCMVFMTTAITYGRGRAVVVDTGMSTEIGRIAASIQRQKDTQTPLQAKFAQMARQIGFAVLVLVAIVFVMGLFSNISTGYQAGNRLIEMLIFSLSLAVAAVPSSLTAIVTIGLALGAKKLAEKKMIIKKLPAAESLGAVTTICSDKTGTLTRNEMTITRIYTNDTDIRVTGSGYEPKGTFEAERLPRTQLELLLTIGLVCNEAELENENGRYTIIGDPTEGALVVAAAKAGITRESLIRAGYSTIYDLPFDSERKRMSVVAKSAKLQAPRAFVKGAPDVMLDRCSKALIGGKQVRLTQSLKRRILEQNEAYAKDALRVLGLAYRDRAPASETTPEKLEQGLVFVGLVGMIDPPRPEVREAIERCRAAGIDVMVITGDHAITTEAVAREIGIFDSERGDRVVTGSEIDAMTDPDLRREVSSIRIIARALPIQKLRVVAALQARGEIVAMTGDGVNDGPALKRADVGVAMGITGTDVAKEVAKGILTDDNFATIVNAVEEGRNIYDKMIKSTRFLLSCNAGEIATIFLALIVKLPMPLIPLQILLMNLVTDGMPALALGVEPSDDDIMNRPPRDPKARPISRSGLLMIVAFGVFMAMGTLYLFQRTLAAGRGLAYAQTVAFTTLVLFEMFAVFGSRSLNPWHKLNPFSNPWLIGAVAISVGLQLAVIYVPWLQTVFGTVALPLAAWAWIVGISSLGFVFMEVSKSFISGE